MGYRAVAITEDTGVTVPQWFMDKWTDQLNIGTYGELGQKVLIGLPRTPISYRWERKWHDDILEDLQKVVAEDTEWSGKRLQMIMMHEDGAVNRINIYADKIIIEAPTGWSTEDYIHMFPGSGV
jgi:hypothetical protein